MRLLRDQDVAARATPMSAPKSASAEAVAAGGDPADEVNSPRGLDARRRVAVALVLILVAIFGVMFLGEHLSGRNWIGVAMIGVGAVPVALKA